MKPLFTFPHFTEPERTREQLEALLIPLHLRDERFVIQCAQTGDADAIAELYRRHAPAIFRYVSFRMNDQAVAEDLTGDVFLEMVQALHRYTERGAPFAAWLFRIAHDRVMDHHRRQARRPTVPLSDSLSDEAPSPEAQAAHQAEAFGLQAAMSGLTDEQRTVLQLRFLEDHSVEMTARIMRKTPGAIKALQHRALSRLGRRLQP